MNCTLKLLICLSLLLTLYSSDRAQDLVEIKEGNLLLPSSQQPSPLFSLGQNIVEKGDATIFLAVSPFFGPKKHSVQVVPYFLYGITDFFSIACLLPFTFLKDNGLKASGFSDICAQIEYAFYEYKRPCYKYQATCLAAFYAPTGSTSAGKTALGAGAPAFLLGATFSYYATDWLWFLSAGGYLATKERSLRSGSSFLYQAGFGKNIATSSGWIFTWMLEFDGNYTTRERFCSVAHPNTGGNVLYLTPSLWASSERFIAQAGISLLPVQHLFGCQTRNEIGGLITLGWKFNG